jgi:nitric oxide reductase activation protein
MALDERLFGAFHRWWCRRREQDLADRSLQVEAHEPMLRRLLPLLAGCDLDLGFGPEPPRLRQRAMLPRTLPVVSSFADTWQTLAWRTALQAAAHATGIVAVAPVPPAAALRRALPELCAWLHEHWPAALDLRAAAERHAAALRLPPDDALLHAFGALPMPGSDTVAEPEPLLVPREALPTGSERRQPQKRTAELVELPANDDGANPLAHVFEKVTTAEEHTGGHRTMDGEDELDAQVEALQELDLRRVVRTRQATKSVFRAEVEVDACRVEIADTAPPSAATTISYDEWDEAGRRYLPAWCAVRTTPAPPPLDSVRARRQAVRLRRDHQALLRTLHHEFVRLAHGHSLQRRQALGADLDIDAIVDHHGTVQAAKRGLGTASEGRLYVARRPSPRDVATLVLLDRSLSSDSWVQGRRVLDVARDATFLLGEVLRGVALPMAIAAFCSHSRRDCRFDVVKDFTDDWQRHGERLFGLEPDGYTRIGPALRHATTLLLRQPARQRLLLVVSDCKPVDYDHYEGRRGTGDVRQALREARRAGVRTLALAIDAAAGAHLPRMFGARGFRIVPSVPQLAVALARLHERMLG